MSTNRTLRKGAVLAGALLATAVLIAGCKKKDDSGSAGETTGGADPGAIAPAGQASGEQNGVMRYTDEAPESGTVATRSSAKVRKAADDSSDLLTTLGPGTNVDRKARKGTYSLVMWPSGVGQLSPGWVATSSLTEGARPVATTTTTTTTTAAATASAAAAAVDAGAKVATVDAGAAPAADAGATAAAKPDAGVTRIIGAIAPPGGRPPGPIKLPGK